MPEVLSDSITTTLTAARDSVASSMRQLWEPVKCHEKDAPTVVGERVHAIGRVPYTSGIAGTPRPALAGYDSGVVCLLLATFLLITLNFRHHTTFLKTFTQDLLSVRRRSNVFEDHTLTETGVMMSLILLVCVCEGLLLFTAFRPVAPFGLGLSGSVFMMTLLALGYYMWELAAYSVTGYVFTDKVYAGQWVRGFNASQALLGLALVVPALAVTYRPGVWSWVAPVSILLYISARIVFICKGFRIFYTNYFSLVYFIVYLCTLEIVPLVVILRLCRFLAAS